MSILVCHAIGSDTVRTDEAPVAAPGNVAQNLTTHRITRAFTIDIHPAANPIGGQIGCAATAMLDEITMTAKLGDSARVHGTHQSGHDPK